jgi:anti-sigma regulatory factor (Ser/Thr protein kinase)
MVAGERAGGGDPHRAVWSLPRRPESVPEGRHLITEHASRFLGNGDATERLKLCASELLTNALQHGAGEDIEVVASVIKKVIKGIRVTAYRVAVYDDGGTGRIVAPGHDDLEGRRVDYGRGLSLVKAVADQWEARQPKGQGTTVWFDINFSQAQDPASGPVRADPAGRAV